MPSRRHFLSRNVALGALALPTVLAPGANTNAAVRQTESFDLNGRWLFRTDPEDQGEKQSWFAGGQDQSLWREVEVPHTWQIEAPLAEYRGVAWYQRTFDTPARSANSAVRIEFEAVFHSAKVWVNGVLAGEHLRKGYTAFTLMLVPCCTAMVRILCLFEWTTPLTSTCCRAAVRAIGRTMEAFTVRCNCWWRRRLSWSGWTWTPSGFPNGRCWFVRHAVCPQCGLAHLER